MNLLEKAWEWRERQGWLQRLDAVRVFHGPGEGVGEWSQLAIEKFGDHYWVTEWAVGDNKLLKQSKNISQDTRKKIVEFLRSKGASSAILLERPQDKVADEPSILLGTPPDRCVVQEYSCRFIIRFSKTRHPGLFLDHAPLRLWLLENAKGWRVLNTFAYTGSLSVAAGKGGADRVLTLDLSRPTLQWAEENWHENGLKSSVSEVLHGDYFECLPKLKRKGERFDCIILDPPSFSRGPCGAFSTSKDLQRLHERALEILSPNGILITSINSANVNLAKYEAEIGAASRVQKVSLVALRPISQPETFPTRVDDPSSRYLKGWVLKKL